MASHASLPSDPAFLLEYMDDLPSESDKDEKFKEYLEPQDWPAAYRSAGDYEEGGGLVTPLEHSHLLDDITADGAATESLLDLSPSPSPMHPCDSTLDSPTLFPMLDSPTSAEEGSSSPTHTSEPPAFTGTPCVVPDMGGKSPIDFFRLFFGSQVLQLIYTETQGYTNQYLEREKEYLEAHPKARAHEWRSAPLLLKKIDVFLQCSLIWVPAGFLL